MVFFSKVSVRCPTSHRWAMEHGQVCCKNFYRASNKEEDIQFEDPREECVNGDIIQCPSLHLKRRCTSDKLSEYSLPDCAVPFVVINRYQGELIPILIVRRAPRFQPLMFTGALDRCLISQTREILRRWLFLTSSYPSGFCRDVGSNPRPPFRGS